MKLGLEALAINPNVLPTIDLANFIRVEPKHCHKVLEKNKFITAASQIDQYQFELIGDVDHRNEDFFFDHEIDHIPGMALACMIRQSVLVITHNFLDIPYEYKFIMDDIAVRYFDRAHLDISMRVKCSFENVKSKGDKISRAEMKASVYQDGRLICQGSINFRVMTGQVYNRLGAFKTKKEE